MIMFGTLENISYLTDVKSVTMTNLKEHPVYKGYWFDKDGNVFSTRQSKTPKLKKPVLNKKNGGYLYTTIQFNGKTISKSVHRMIAETWIPNPEGKETVDHINENKLDNRVENLEWATRKEQMERLIASGNFPSRKGENNGRAKLTKEEVQLVRFLRSNGYTISYIHKEINEKVSKSMIETICLGKHWR